MSVFNDRIRFSTSGNCEVADLTAQVKDAVRKSQMQEGTCTVFAPGATAAITTIEYEPGVLQDLQEFFDRLLPAGKRYHHDAAWQDGNGHSHLRASLVGPSLSIPVVDSRLTLGTWQQIVFVDFDARSREREVVVQVVG